MTGDNDVLGMIFLGGVGLSLSLLALDVGALVLAIFERTLLQ
jgi:hypothetical protein